MSRKNAKGSDSGDTRTRTQTKRKTPRANGRRIKDIGMGMELSSLSMEFRLMFRFSFTFHFVCPFVRNLLLSSMRTFWLVFVCVEFNVKMMMITATAGT